LGTGFYKIILSIPFHPVHFVSNGNLAHAWIIILNAKAENPATSGTRTKLRKEIKQFYGKLMLLMKNPITTKSLLVCYNYVYRKWMLIVIFKLA
jgi:hypothetical protein